MNIITSPIVKKGFHSIVLFFFFFIWLLPGTAQAAETPLSLAAAPVATLIQPSVAANNADTPVVIQGSNITPDTKASLGSTILNSIYISSTQLSATVPWGLEPGAYPLTLTNPGETPFVLDNAFTVTLGIGKWINHGPFGGEINDLVLQPGNPSRLYACVHEAGLFVSTDGGASWSMLVDEGFPMRLLISPVDPQVLYLNTNRAIRRSKDGGASWTSIEPPQNSPSGTLAAFPHPSITGTVFIAASPNTNNYNEGGDGELWKSTDYGDTLAPLTNTLLTDKRITELVFDPRDLSHQTMVAGTISGKIFQTTNGGTNWAQKADLYQSADQNPARIDRLIYNPFAASGIGEFWAVKRNPFLPTDWPVLYRSNTDLTSWTSVMVVDNPINGPHPWFWMRPWSVTFTADKIWAAYDTGYSSSNASDLAWTTLNPQGIPNESWRDFEFKSFVVDPANPTTIYAGTRAHGVYKSLDGGQTWADSNQGLAGVIPYALAVSPDNLDEVYSISQSEGVMKSIDGGRNWTSLNFRRDGMPWTQTSLVVDQHDPTVVYIGKWCPGSRPSNPISDACIRISRNRGLTWEDVILDMPTEVTEPLQFGEVFAIAVDPNTPGRVVAGATFYPSNWSWQVEHPYGVFYISDDYGKTWTRSNLDARLVKGSYKISFDTVVPDLVYASTDGTGLWKSTNGGKDWERVSWTNCADTGEGNVSVSVHGVVTRPKVANEVYAFCSVTVNQQFRSGGLYRSTNAGLNWSPVQSPPSQSDSLLFLQSSGMGLYAGSARSFDGGNSWTLIDGVPTSGTVYASAGGSNVDRAVLYISTAAGMGTNVNQVNVTAAQAKTGNQKLMAGGTYGLTMRLESWFVYLPLVFKNP
jgi:photosystem II stability/assembly factor-like uncharacterized protein